MTPKNRKHAPRSAGSSAQDSTPGLAVRRIAAQAIEAILETRQPLDEVFDRLALPLTDLDRALAYRIAVTTLRHHGWIEAILSDRLSKSLPEKLLRLRTSLWIGLAQILFLDVPDHAAVDCSVELVRRDSRTKGFSGLVNAVLRGVAREQTDVLADLDPLTNLPGWLAERWCAAYGEDRTRRIAAAVMTEAPLDITVKSDPGHWAKTLDGLVLATGSVRLRTRQSIPSLPGFAEGAWWVQDAAAALPARLIGARPGLEIADFCAAPGGKTAQLALTGASITAIDRAAPRLRRLQDNMARLGLHVETLVADATGLPATHTHRFDAILLDAPCSATGTLRSHPDLALLKRPEDVANLAALQSRLIDAAIACLKPGGTLVYATCSLEPEEGPQQIANALERHPGLALLPITPADLAGIDAVVQPDGTIRTFPDDWPATDGAAGGLDGFYTARLVTH